MATLATRIGQEFNTIRTVDLPLKLDTSAYNATFENIAGNTVFKNSLVPEGTTESITTNDMTVNGTLLVNGEAVVPGAETLTSLEATGNILTYTDENGTANDIDLSTINGTNLSTDAPVNLTSSLGYNKGDGSLGAIVLQPEGGFAHFRTATFNGFIKITLPTAWSQSFISMEIDVFNYTATANAETYKLRVSGYLYSLWGTDREVSIISSNGVVLPKVIFGDDGTHSCLWIAGNDGLAHVWKYTNVRVSNVMVGNLNSTLNIFATGWTITQEVATVNERHVMNAKLTATDSLNADALGNTPASDIINSINDLETSINGLASFSEPLVIDYANPVIKMNDNDGSPTDQSINIRANGTNIELPRNGQAIIIEQSSTNVAAENFADLIVTGEIYAGNLDPKLGNKVIHEGNMNNYNFIKTNTQASGSWLDLFAGNTGSQFDLSIGGGRSVLGSTIATLRFVNNYNNNTGILSVNGYGQATWNNNLEIQGEFNLTGGTQGDILYHDGTSFVKLAAGTQGQVLTMGAGGIPEWV